VLLLLRLLLLLYLVLLLLLRVLLLLLPLLPSNTTLLYTNDTYYPNYRSQKSLKEETIFPLSALICHGTRVSVLPLLKEEENNGDGKRRILLKRANKTWLIYNGVLNRLNYPGSLLK